MRIISFCLTALLCSVLVAGCAHRTPAPAAEPAPAPATENYAEIDQAQATIDRTKEVISSHDPYEGFNRKMFGLNDRLDRYVLRPVARGYNFIMPNVAQKGVRNFFRNISTLNAIPNDMLQGKIKYALTDTWRFLINSTIGIAGLFDVATPMGLPKHRNNFGLTLAYWSGDDGSRPQPYLVLPILGSGTPRSMFGKPFDIDSIIALYYPNDIQYYVWGATALRAVNARASLLFADKLLDQAFDRYIFIRSAYQQSRARQLKRSYLESNFKPDAQVEEELGKTNQKQHRSIHFHLNNGSGNGDSDMPDELPADFNGDDADSSGSTSDVPDELPPDLDSDNGAVNISAQKKTSLTAS